MNRREFLAALGATAAAVALNGVPLADFPEGAPLALMVGDVITIDGVYAINPMTRKATPYLQQFVITATAPTVTFMPSRTGRKGKMNKLGR